MINEIGTGPLEGPMLLLRRRRAGRHITQALVARQLGVSIALIANVEAGRMGLDAESVARWCKAIKALEKE